MSAINDPTDDVLRASRLEVGQIDLVDKSGKSRATLACSSDDDSGYVVMHLYDQQGLQRLSLQVDDKDGPSITLWRDRSPCVSLAVTPRGNGIVIGDAEGRPLINVGVRGGQDIPQLSVWDLNGNKIFGLP